MDKKALRGQVEAKLETALADFSKDVSNKKFKKHIKKASKILSDGLLLPGKKAIPKKVAVKEAKVLPKKAAPKKAKKAAKAKAPAK